MSSFHFSATYLSSSRALSTSKWSPQQASSRPSNPISLALGASSLMERSSTGREEGYGSCHDKFMVGLSRLVSGFRLKKLFDLNWCAGRGLVGGVDDLHEAERLIRGIEGGFDAFNGADKVLGGTDAPHVLARFSDDAAVHGVAVFLDVELAGVEAVSSKPSIPKRRSTFPPARVPWKTTETSSRWFISTRNCGR